MSVKAKAQKPPDFETESCSDYEASAHEAQLESGPAPFLGSPLTAFGKTA
jgi:hypothetical protein